MKLTSVVVDRVKVRRLSYPYRDRAAMITIASALGWHSFNTPREGYQFPVRGLHPERGRPDDMRSRENVPDFGTLDEAWDVLNWFEVRYSQPIGLAFRLVLGEDWCDYAHTAGDLTRQIMDAAYSAIVAGRKVGWV